MTRTRIEKLPMKTRFPFAFGLWLVTSTMLFVVSIVRIIRFHWLLKAHSYVDNDLSNGLSADVASQLRVTDLLAV